MSASSEGAIAKTAMARRDQIPLVALYTANAISMVGNVLMVLAVPWFVLQTTASAEKTGVTGFFEALPIALARVWRTDRRSDGCAATRRAVFRDCCGTHWADRDTGGDQCALCAGHRRNVIHGGAQGYGSACGVGGFHEMPLRHAINRASAVSPHTRTTLRRRLPTHDFYVPTRYIQRFCEELN